MPTKAISTLEKIESSLFSSDEEKLKMSPAEQEIMLRYHKTFTFWNEHPKYTERQIIDYLKDNFGIEKSQAYRDLRQIKRLLGNVEKVSKDWERHRLTQMALDGYQKAMADKQYMAAAAFLEKIGKYNKLDKDEDIIDWSLIEINDIEPTNNIIVLDKRLYKPDAQERILACRAKYNPSALPDTDFEDVPNE